MTTISYRLRHRKQFRECLAVNVHGTRGHHDGGPNPAALQVVTQTFQRVAEIRVGQLQFVD